MSAPLGLYCPGCREHAALVLTAEGTAFCGNEVCHILMWDPSKTLAELAAGMKTIDLSRIFRDQP